MPDSTSLRDTKNQVADADFEPNPDRAIWLEGQLNDALLERLRPEIERLVSYSRKPITVFINSRGGSSEVGEGILRLLRRTTQDDRRVSRIITVAAPKAASAAANLLSAGDFAIACPGSGLMYHGARWPLPVQELTGEWAKIAQTLPTFHELAAAALARNSVRRFLFILAALRPTFEQHRAEANDPTISDLRCFQAILCGKLSPAGQKVLELAVPLCDSHHGLLHEFEKRLRRRRGRTVTDTHLRRLMLHASTAFEYESNKGEPSWDGGLSRICDGFYFLNAYFDVGTLCDWVAAQAEPQTASTDVEADYVLQFRVFFLALCRALQEGENLLTPVDCVWLGLIDTVRTDLAALNAS